MARSLPATPSVLLGSVLAALLAASAAQPRSGVFVAGAPPDYVANCSAGSSVVRLQIPGTLEDGNGTLVCDASACTGGGPFLQVHGAAHPGVDGVYTYLGNGTDRQYGMGDYTLLWEPGPREVHGLRWRLFGPGGLLYYKYTQDGYLGWRGSNSTGAWSLASGSAFPAPTVTSGRPEQELVVEDAGDPGAVGSYARISGTGESKVYRKGAYWIHWEPGPQVATGYRWVIFRDTDPSGKVSQYRPYYYRLSEDGDFGFQGAWATDRGFYPPPSVALVQTVMCASCAAGFYSAATGATSCQRCPPGFYSLGAAAQCTACLAGRFVDGTVETRSVRKDPACEAGYLAAGRGSCTMPLPGASGCASCPRGRYSGAAAGNCSDCPAGRFGGTEGLDGCLDCAAGRWSGPGAAACSPCPAGRAGNGTLAQTPSECSLCPPGRFAAAAASTACVDCQAGEFAHRQGSTACRACAAGSYIASPASSRCEACPSLSSGPGATSCQA